MERKRGNCGILGKLVLPLVKRSQYGAAECDSSGQLNYITDENKRIAYAKRVVDERCAEMKKINKEQVWRVEAVHSGGSFDLMSDMGYQQRNVSRSDFRLIKTKKK